MWNRTKDYKVKLKIAIKFEHANFSKMRHFIFDYTTYIKYYYSFKSKIKSNQNISVYHKFFTNILKLLDIVCFLEIETCNLLKSVISYYINIKNFNFNHEIV